MSYDHNDDHAADSHDGSLAMAKIILIAQGTVRPGICEIGDIVSIHDDDVELGSAYNTFTVLSFPGLAEKQTLESFTKLKPEQSKAYKTKAESDKWSLEIPQEKQVWKNKDGLWMFLEMKPKYDFSLSSLSTGAKTELEDDKVDTSVRLLTLESQVKEKISLDVRNLTEVTDLNK